ncbi:solute carrier family 25 (peroxisomal adenine nucleotide transporter), member 17, partial [Tremellales sp. Uapishka_1]
MGDSAIHAVAGAVGGCVSMALTYPLVNLSTRAAVQTKKEDLTIPQAIAKTLKEEGLSGLYAGLNSSLFGIAVTNGVYYAFCQMSPRFFQSISDHSTDEETRSLLIRRRPATATSPSSLSTSEGIIAGMLAGSITTLVTNPIWTVQAHQSTRAVTLPQEGGEVKVKPSAMSSIQEILKQDGIKGFWRGIGPALILVINPVIQYTTFERLTSLLLNYRLSKGVTPTGKRGTGRGALSDWDLFFLGALSKLVATGGTYPYIVVKSRLQAATHKYKSSIKAVLSILHNEGVAGLYAGLLPKLLQSVLTAAFMFVAQRRVYEAVKKMIMIAAEKKGVIARV